jgi:hypothetical protein
MKSAQKSHLGFQEMKDENDIQHTKDFGESSEENARGSIILETKHCTGVKDR